MDISHAINCFSSRDIDEVLIPALGFFYGKGIVRVARAATHDVIAKDFH